MSTNTLSGPVHQSATQAILAKNMFGRSATRSAAVRYSVINPSQKPALRIPPTSSESLKTK